MNGEGTLDYPSFSLAEGVKIKYCHDQRPVDSTTGAKRTVISESGSVRSGRFIPVLCRGLTGGHLLNQ